MTILTTIANWIFPKIESPTIENNKNLEVCPVSLQERDYRRLAEEALQKAITILETDGWKKEKINGSDIIYSKIVPPYGKVWKWEGILHVSPRKVVDILYFKSGDMNKWDTSVKSIEIIQKIDYHHDIAHVISTECAAGLVSSRDFVNVRTWRNKELGYVFGSVGISHPDVPVIAKYVRGEFGPTVYIMTPADKNGETTKLQMLINANIKGWVPQYLIDQTIPMSMMDYIKNFKKYTNTKENA